MKVKELIKQLKELDQDKPIFIIDRVNDDYLAITEIKEYTKYYFMNFGVDRDTKQADLDFTALGED